MSDHSDVETAESATSGDGIGDRLRREWRLWIEFAPEAVGSVVFLLFLWLATVGFEAISLWIGAGGTLLWLVAAGIWVLLGRRPRSGKR